ncbi:hypothetical protein M9H77_23188 [Catharanthus roseus]|uniref:Uncharacterized protein n=1 Tax=Catharanthus roseus TaxID=4058 RepID=A0ACC0ASM1_CATRO|nr:hypothetical protein M9H77_23188 [Catharanthus roseus]
MAKNPTQPCDHKFLQTDFGEIRRSFQKIWFKDFTWLEYNVHKRSAFDRAQSVISRFSTSFALISSALIEGLLLLAKLEAHPFHPLADNKISENDAGDDRRKSLSSGEAQIDFNFERSKRPCELRVWKKAKG